jgi:hypothetical protein
MIHLENRHLIEMVNAPDVTNWKLHLVIRWADGNPLSGSQQDAIANTLTNSVDTGIAALTLEAQPDIPYAYLDLDVETSQTEVVASLEKDAVDIESIYEWQRKEVVLGKGITAALGSWACAGIDLETVELETAYLAETAELAEDHPGVDNVDLYITSEKYRIDELAIRAFEKEKETYIDLQELLKAA